MRTGIVVVGAGVIGLSCAVRLAETGHDVHVMARDLPLETTSAVAAGLWYPYRAAPVEAVTRWAKATFTELTSIAATAPEAGVDLVAGVEFLRTPQPDPWWIAAGPPVERLAATQRRTGYADGWRMTVPVVDTSHYLPWLVGRLERSGGTLTRHWFDALPASGVVVNACGLAARHLAADDSLQPVRGQVLRIDAPAVRTWTLGSDDPARPVYVVPRRDDVIVGGTATENDWDVSPDEATSRSLLARARELEPRLAGARVLGVRVGLRPVRPTVRLETERVGEAAIVHCYGHGGSGITLSWGCADDVLRQIDALL